MVCYYFLYKYLLFSTDNGFACCVCCVMGEVKENRLVKIAVIARREAAHYGIHSAPQRTPGPGTGH